MRRLATLQDRRKLQFMRNFEGFWRFADRASTGVNAAVEWLRTYFHWQISGAVVSVLAGVLGSTLVGIGWYYSSEVCFGAAGLVCLLWAFTLRSPVIARASLMLVSLAATGFLVVAIDHKREADALEDNKRRLAERERILEQNFGVLTSADDPEPPLNRCMAKHPDRIFTIFFGNGTLIVYRFPVIVISVGRSNYFSIAKGANGSLILDVEVPDREGRVIANITDGHYVINPNNILRKEHQD
jgi:hypothetical protein